MGRPSSDSLQGKPQFSWAHLVAVPLEKSLHTQKSIFVSLWLAVKTIKSPTPTKKKFSSAYNKCCVMEKIRFLATIQAVLLSFVTSVPFFLFHKPQVLLHEEKKVFKTHVCSCLCWFLFQNENLCFVYSWCHIVQRKVLYCLVIVFMPILMRKYFFFILMYFSVIGIS